jgi:hypothetical protein
MREALGLIFSRSILSTDRGTRKRHRNNNLSRNVIFCPRKCLTKLFCIAYEAMVKTRKSSSSITQRPKKHSRTETQNGHDASEAASDCTSTPHSNLPIPDVQSRNMES